MDKKFDDMVGEIEVSLGATKMTLEEFTTLKPGSVVDIGIPAGEPAFILVNKNPIGRGDIMVFEKNLAVRVNEITSSNEVYHYSREYFGL